jgi:hypothetical protein
MTLCVQVADGSECALSTFFRTLGTRTLQVTFFSYFGGYETMRNRLTTLTVTLPLPQTLTLTLTLTLVTLIINLTRNCYR